MRAWAFLAEPMAPCTAGKASPAKIAIMAMTTRSSMSVKADILRGKLGVEEGWGAGEDMVGLEFM